jgi:hypothetical protein
VNCPGSNPAEKPRLYREGIAAKDGRLLSHGMPHILDIVAQYFFVIDFAPRRSAISTLELSSAEKVRAHFSKRKSIGDIQCKS